MRIYTLVNYLIKRSHEKDQVKESISHGWRLKLIICLWFPITLRYDTFVMYGFCLPSVNRSKSYLNYVRAKYEITKQHLLINFFNRHRVARAVLQTLSKLGCCQLINGHPSKSVKDSHAPTDWAFTKCYPKLLYPKDWKENNEENKVSYKN